MTTRPEIAKSGTRWLGTPAWLSASPYRKPAIFAILLLGVPLLLRLVEVPFATTFTVMAFVCIMRFLIVDAWPRNPETGIRRRWGLVPFAYVFGVMLFIGVWATQPHFGANVCPSKGFMWSTDFVEEIRPTIHRSIGNQVQRNSELFAGVNVAQFIAVADQAVDLLKQCVAERSVNYCRYAGSDPNGVMMEAYTRDGPNDIAPKDRDKYRFIKAGLDYDISMVQQDIGLSWFRIRTSRFGKPLDAGGQICGLGCWCKVN